MTAPLRTLTLAHRESLRELFARNVLVSFGLTSSLRGVATRTTVAGNTYPIAAELKALGFAYRKATRTWSALGALDLDELPRLIAAHDAHEARSAIPSSAHTRAVVLAGGGA